MEHLEAISEINWNFSDETEVIMSQLLGAYPCMNEPDQEINLGIQPMLWSYQDGSSYNLINNLSSFWPGTGDTASTSSFFPPHPEFQSYEQMTASMDYFTPEGQMTGSSLVVDNLILLKDYENELKDNGTSNTPETIVVPKHSSLAKRKNLELKDGIPTKSPKKKAQASMQVQKNSKNASAKESKKSVVSAEVLSNVSCSSEGESNTSQELNELGTSSAKGKLRASCRSATDPQSLYARKRRERINERLRILQNLVPNGTKVDISTMLEEAVQYVKFLQLQIKLLSSDDLWMYAPLAYNGMDLRLDLKIPLPQL